MSRNKLAKAKPGPATQRYLDIAELRDDMVIMKDGTVRAVLLVSSINFALKSDDEQQATVQAYMTFLNSLDYPIQIVVQSRKMNIDPYLQSLADFRKKTSNELLRAQIDDYRDFVKELVELGEIMQKSFFVVIPYDPVTNKRKNFWNRLSEAASPSVAAKSSPKQLAERKEQMMRRVGTVGGSLMSMGLEAIRLDTQGLIELYYNAYNPDIFSEEHLKDISSLMTEEK